MPFIGMGKIEGGAGLRKWMGRIKNPVLNVLNSRRPSVIKKDDGWSVAIKV